MRVLSTQCCIVGGGPAGMMLGYLLARSGVDVTVIEKHGDFLRDFRGDTVHPSTMQALADVGLLEEFLTLPHRKVTRVGGTFEGETVTIGNFESLDTPAPFIAFMPQWDFLNFIASKGKELPGFHLLMNTKVERFIEDNGRVVGVEAGASRVMAPLVVACDGRRSILRDQSGLPIEDLGAAIDVMWFKLSVPPGHRIERGVDIQVRGTHFLILIDRGDHFQCAYIVKKGDADGLMKRGMHAFHDDVVFAMPGLAPVVGELKSFDDVKVLSVSVERLKKWFVPGLLFIGDAAHTMSPVGGVGINLAIQDAVAAANALVQPLLKNEAPDAVLASIQKRREGPARMIQRFQGLVQRAVLEPTLRGTKFKLPLPLRVVSKSKWLQQRLGKFVGLGVRLERVTTPLR